MIVAHVVDDIFNHEWVFVSFLLINTVELLLKVGRKSPADHHTVPNMTRWIWGLHDTYMTPPAQNVMSFLCWTLTYRGKLLMYFLLNLVTMRSVRRKVFMRWLTSETIEPLSYVYIYIYIYIYFWISLPHAIYATWISNTITHTRYIHIQILYSSGISICNRCLSFVVLGYLVILSII